MSKYISIYKKIKSDILNNIIKPNEKLESKRVLSEKLQVSINTVIQAYNLLLDEGLII
ncbi:MAG: GntR family transcriptional regulator, partial [Acholeplasmatales bacterium]|nr:GntR family transcriptional regulator [Acholeplasmatales bacterium]